MAEYQPRYSWRATGLGMEQDFCCRDGDRTVGRIYLANGMSEAGWFWSMMADGPAIDRRGKTLSGYVVSPREAARHVEEAWDAVRPAAGG